MFCPFCGKEIDDDAMFCGECGNKIPTNEEIDAAKRIMKEEYETRVRNDAQPTEGYTDNNIVVGGVYEENNVEIDESYFGDEPIPNEGYFDDVESQGEGYMSEGMIGGDVTPGNNIGKKKKNVNKKLIAIICVLLAIGIGVGVYFYTRPTRIDVNKYLKVKFEGYNTIGTAYASFEGNLKAVVKAKAKNVKKNGIDLFEKEFKILKE